MDELVFNDIARQEYPVTIEGKKYVLRECNGETAARFRSASAKCARMEGERLASLEGVGELQPLLVSLCLFELYEDHGETKSRPVLLSQVQAWTDRVVKAIYDKAREMNPSLFEKDTRDDAKNSQSVTRNGSASLIASAE